MARSPARENLAMPSLFKSKTVAYKDRKGHRCKKGTPGTRKVVIESKNWYGRYKDSEGKTVTVPLCPDKGVAKEMLAKRIIDAKMATLGMIDKFADHRHRQLDGHLDDFKRALLAKGNTEKQAKQVYNRAKAVVDGCDFDTTGDIDSAAVLEWLAAERVKCTSGRRKGGISIQTSNF
jgi:hypothetical protein